MRTFKDRNGKDWAIELTLTTANNLKTDAGIDVYAFRAGGVDGFEQLEALRCDPVKTFNALRILTQEARDRLSITPEQFGNGLSGDTLKGAGEALVRGVIDFFPDQGYRDILHEVMDKSDELRTQIIAQAKAKVGELTAIPSTSKNSPGNGPASSESTPADSASDNSK